LNALYQDLLNQDINNVKIIAIGKGQYSADNSDWTDDNTIPVVNDPSPNDIWTNWGASQWDLFFLDLNGNYVEDFNINPWDYDAIYNTILGLLTSGCTDPEACNYDPDATEDDGSCLALDCEGVCGGSNIASFLCINGDSVCNPAECPLCDGEYTEIDNSCYYQSDLDALQDIIDLNGLNEETSGNDMDNGDGIFEPIELGGQVWFNNRLSRLSLYRSFGKLNYEISVIPESIGNLNELIFLDLDNNQIENLPDEFINLNLLETLWFGDGNPLNTIPTVIFQLINLTLLGIYDTNISEVPPEIGNLTNLTDLYLFNNHITTLPESIGSLMNLTLLNLSKNQLTTLPESICDLPESNNFDFRLNNICSIPSCMYWIQNQNCEEINCPDDLTELNGDCYFQGDVDVLQDIINVNESLSAIEPLEIVTGFPTLYPTWTNGRLTNLSLWYYLDIQLTTLPESIGNLSNLERLYLASNQLTTLPESIGNLSNLERLYLEGNQITTLPESFCNLSIDWGGTYEWGFNDSYFYFSIDNNNLCPPYPECIKDYVGEQDTTNCPIMAITDDILPINYNLYNSYPNPFNPTTTISFSIPKLGLATITAYDINGRKLETLTNEVLSIGNYSINWNASSYPSGVYLIRMDSRDFTQTQKVLLVK